MYYLNLIVEKRKKVVFFSLFLSVVFISGCGEKSSKEIRMNDIAYGNHPRQTMDIALPPHADEQHKVPVVFCIHGGSWSSGDKKDFEWIKEMITNANCAYVSINYRLLQDNVTYVQMLQDIEAAIVRLKTCSEDYHLKTDKMCIIGSSAGGHLAMLYAWSEESPVEIALVASRVGPADFTDPEQIRLNGVEHLHQINLLLGTQVTLSQAESVGFVFPEAWYAASPVYHIKRESPPAVLAYGEKDALVSYSNALILKNKLEEYDVDHRLISFPNSGHELNNDPDKLEEFRQALILFLRTCLL
ncbi:MAG: alpha/beta hydrolase [Bacteroidales bacterium]|jgi:acetyl esterase/lipase|nr:alpha/beta hydrolase [Bacteroidales bacterium]